MFDILLTISGSFVITFFTIPAIILIADRKKLYDIPDNRKTHTAIISSFGGVAIFAGFMLTCLYVINFSSHSGFQYLIAAAFIIFFLGLNDDIMVISPTKKIIGQLLAAFLIVYKGNLHIESMQGFLGIFELPGILSALLTYFTLIVIINSFNLIDGVDGLAGSLGLMVSLFLGIYFLQANVIPYAILSLSLAGSLTAFLMYNLQPAKIFMGDTGSLLIGLICAILVIKFINFAPANPVFPIAVSPAIGFSLLVIPLLDTLRVFTLRMLNRRSPFSADRNHIHHILLDKGFSHRRVTQSLLVINILFIVMAFSLRLIGNTSLIFLCIALFFTGITALKYSRQRSGDQVINSVGQPRIKVIQPSQLIASHNSVREMEEN
jgi:UDP-N-acetylmuramyl pentapeptide phosphotransferase/UDP-N-acetylglucosamine-1-phosphate transferase